MFCIFRVFFIIVHHILFLVVLVLLLDPLLNNLLIDSQRFLLNPPLVLLQQMLSAQAITVQVALLYTNSSGERRIRVHTVLLPVVQVSYISITCNVVRLLHHGTFGHRFIHSLFVCESILSLTFYSLFDSLSSFMLLPFTLFMLTSLSCRSFSLCVPSVVPPNDSLLFHDSPIPVFPSTYTNASPSLAPSYAVLSRFQRCSRQWT